MIFRIFAHGVHFDVDSYCEVSSLTLSDVWYIDENFETNGLAIVLGDGHVLSLDQQDQIACEYLEECEDALRELANYDGVDVFSLGLVYVVQKIPGLSGFCMSASNRLLLVASRIGIKVTFYVDLLPYDEASNAMPDW